MKTLALLEISKFWIVSAYINEIFCELSQSKQKLIESALISNELINQLTKLISFSLQLELITELLGTPSMDDMRYACDGARSHMLRRAPKPASLTMLYTLSSHATHEAVHLLCQMLVFDPVSKLINFFLL